MVWRKSIPLRVAVDIARANRFSLTDYGTKQPAAARQFSDSLSGGFIDAGGDELDQRLTVLAQDPQRRIPCPDHVARGIDNLLQYMRQIMLREDREAGSQESLEPLANPLRFTPCRRGCHGARYIALPPSLLWDERSASPSRNNPHNL
jgi:hypothetical protein